MFTIFVMSRHFHFIALADAFAAVLSVGSRMRQQPRHRRPLQRPVRGTLHFAFQVIYVSSMADKRAIITTNGAEVPDKFYLRICSVDSVCRRRARRTVSRARMQE